MAGETKTAIVGAIAAIGCAVISGYFTVKASRSSEDAKTASNQVATTSSQVAAGAVSEGYDTTVKPFFDQTRYLTVRASGAHGYDAESDSRTNPGDLRGAARRRDSFCAPCPAPSEEAGGAKRRTIPVGGLDEFPAEGAPPMMWIAPGHLLRYYCDPAGAHTYSTFG
jgi:hypothetical protein